MFFLFPFLGRIRRLVLIQVLVIVFFTLLSVIPFFFLWF